MFDVADAEGDATALHQLAGSDPGNPLGPETIARRLLGRRCIRPAPRTLGPARAALTRNGEQWEIWLPRGLPTRQRTFAIAHELAEWWVRRRVEPWIEDYADLLAAAIIAPRQAFLPLYREVGADLPELAETFETSETCVALRVGEATGIPCAVISPERVRVRGEPFGWPPANELRRLASQASPRAPIVRVRLGDQRGRTLIVHDERCA